MAFNELLAERVELELRQQSAAISEIKKMFGGLCFMVDQKMCIGVVKDQLMVRLDPEEYEEMLSRDGCEPMNFTGRTMKGFVFVNSEGYDLDEDLAFWVDRALAYNPKAKASAKRKKK